MISGVSDEVEDLFGDGMEISRRSDHQIQSSALRPQFPQTD